MTKHDELVALLTEIRDRLPIDDATNARYEREDAEARQDDPDEALADVLKAEYGKAQWWLDVARAARERIEANALYAYRTVAAERDKAESDLADMTRQRDALGRMADHNHDVAAKVKAERDEWQERHAALRSDVDEMRRDFDRGLWPDFKGILARDTERGQA